MWNMTPDRRDRKSRARTKRPQPRIPTGPSPEDAHEIVYFKRHKDDDPTEECPGRAFMRACPGSVRAKFNACLNAVAKAPPHRFAGGGYWEAMKGEMTGWYEVRMDGPPNRTHYRLFCLLDYDAFGADRPLLVVVTGKSKRFQTVFHAREYKAIRALGDEFRSRNPRSWS